MPIPQPRPGESQDDFIDRCMADPVMNEEYEDLEQRAGVCHSQWEERSVQNDLLLKAVRERGTKRTEFGLGIQTADKYVRTMAEVGGCPDFDRMVKEAADVLVYSNPDMKTMEVADGSHRFKEFMEGAPEGVEAPKNTLILFRCVLTTPRKDRDGDILRTKGAVVDPKMLLLWQHVHTLPLGKYLYTTEHSEDALKVVSAVVDMNELCHDAAVMIDNGMGRFSHGFRALEFTEMKADESDPTSPGGYDVKRFEIMEKSIVSVPSNVDAETEEILFSMVSDGKLTSPQMRRWGEKIREKRPLTVPGFTSVTTTEKLGDYERSVTVTKQIKQEENRDENESRAGEGEKEGRPARPSEEADDGPGQGEAKGTDDAEVKEMRPCYGSLEGSWEWTIQKLNAAARPFLTGSGVSMGERDWTWIVGVYLDNAIVCVEKPESGVQDEYRYFKIDWELDGKEPRFTGEPKQVEIEVSTEIRERSPAWETKGEKRGRVLSKANEDKIRDARESVLEAAKVDDVPRAVRSMLREAAGTLKSVLDSLGDSEGETSAFADVGTAKGLFLAFASSTERREMIADLQTLQEIEQRKRNTRKFRPVLSGRSR